MDVCLFQSERPQRCFLLARQGGTRCNDGAGPARGPLQYNLAVAQQQPQTPVPLQRGDIPQIVVFDNDSLLRAHIYFFSNTPALGKWGNSISSMVILSGRWEFFDEEKFQGTKTELGPGMYLNVKDHGINDNSISSMRLVGSPTAR
jgi:hypothetical protein